MEHFVLYGPQAEMKGRGCLRLQGLRELDIQGTVHLRLPLNGVLYCLRGEIVDDGVETAVGHSDAQSDGIDGPNHRFHCAALQGFRPHQCIENKVDVVGDETKAEDGEVDDDHPQDLFLVHLPPSTDSLWPPQSLEHHSGANHVQYQGDKEPHCLDEDHHLRQMALPLI